MASDFQWRELVWIAGKDVDRVTWFFEMKKEKISIAEGGMDDHLSIRRMLSKMEGKPGGPSRRWATANASIFLPVTGRYRNFQKFLNEPGPTVRERINQTVLEEKKWRKKIGRGSYWQQQRARARSRGIKNKWNSIPRSRARWVVNKQKSVNPLTGPAVGCDRSSQSIAPPTTLSSLATIFYSPTSENQRDLRRSTFALSGTLFAQTFVPNLESTLTR